MEESKENSSFFLQLNNYKNFQDIMLRNVFDIVLYFLVSVPTINILLHYS